MVVSSRLAQLTRPYSHFARSLIMNTLSTVTATALLAAASVAGAQTAGQMGAENSSPPAQKAGATPATFVTTAAEDGMTEIALAKLAETKSSNSEIKQFAQKMDQDHGQANARLAQLAHTKGLTVPNELDKKHQAMVTAMSHKSGAAFDASYSEHMAKAHAKAVALFESAAQSSDKDVAAFANKTLPTLHEHQKMANNLEQQNGAKRSASAPSPSDR
jgi:putative membrane protein